jgi:hypothetical protein
MKQIGPLQELNMTKTIATESVIRKCLRLGAFLFCLQFSVALVVAHRARAEVRDLMRSVGSQMMMLGENVRVAKPRTLMVNGAELRLRVQTVEGMSFQHVLDVLEERCRSRNGRFHEQIEAFRGRAKLTKESLDFLDGVMREEDESAGMVACLDMGEKKVTPSELLERLQKFAKTGDAAAVGDLRYARVEKSGQDAFVVMLWTDGPIQLKRMFPATGDAPGIDFAGLPRPPEARRVLSAWEEGEGPALNMYVSETLDRKQLEERSLKALAARGWNQLMPMPEPKGQKQAGTMLMKDGVTVVVTTGEDASGHGLLNILPMDSVGQASVTR